MEKKLKSLINKKVVIHNIVIGLLITFIIGWLLFFNNLPKNNSVNIDSTFSENINVGDVVTIKHFDIIGIVIEKIENEYIILYKDQQNQIQKISIQKFMLKK